MNQNQLKMTIDDSGVIWCMPSGIAKRFGIGRTTAYTLIKEFKAIPKYKKSYLDLSWQLKLIRLSDFETFLQEKSCQYLRE